VEILNESEAAFNWRGISKSWFPNPELAIHPNLKPSSGKWPPAKLGDRSCKIDQMSAFNFEVTTTKDLDNNQPKSLRNHNLCSRNVTGHLYLAGLWESLHLAGKFPHK